MHNLHMHCSDNFSAGVVEVAYTHILVNFRKKYKVAFMGFFVSCPGKSDFIKIKLEVKNLATVHLMTLKVSTGFIHPIKMKTQTKFQALDT